MPYHDYIDICVGQHRRLMNVDPANAARDGNLT